jgi:hypothetical protein
MKTKITLLTILCGFSTEVIAQTSGGIVINNNHGYATPNSGSGFATPPNAGNGFVTSGLSNRFAVPGQGFVTPGTNNQFAIPGNGFVTPGLSNRFVVPTNFFMEPTNVFITPSSALP